MKDLIGFLQYYDHDNTIPVYGFGAKMLPYHDIVSQCFACNKDYFNPDIIGIDEIIENYKKVVKEVKFHGPSAINELVKLAIEYAKDEKLDQFKFKLNFSIVNIFFQVKNIIFCSFSLMVILISSVKLKLKSTRPLNILFQFLLLGLQIQNLNDLKS